MAKAVLSRAVGGAAGLAGAFAAYRLTSFDKQDVSKLPWADVDAKPPSRKDQISALKGEEFDLLVIGGGAAGTGIALDGSTRGLKTALVDAEDFAAGTSSKSAKLAYGGARYVQNAVSQMDFYQMQLAVEALFEREHVLTSARHISRQIPTLTPCYEYWEVPYIWLGMKAYDLLAFCCGSSLPGAHFAGKAQIERGLPVLAHVQPQGATIKGGVVSHDGQFNDSRLCVAVACSAAMSGATVANYVKVVSLLRDKEGVVRGARCKDIISGREFNVKAKTVINATGVSPKVIRTLGNKDASKTAKMLGTRQTHVTLPEYYSGGSMGLVVPGPDNQKLFLLPWEGSTIVGSCQQPSEVSARPVAAETEVNSLLNAIQPYLALQVRKSDVMSSWAGVQPVMVSESAAEEAGEGDEKIVQTGEDNLISVVGGMCPNYRRVAEVAVNKAIEIGGLQQGASCSTYKKPLMGSAMWRPGICAEMMQRTPPVPGVDLQTVAHLSATYGDHAPCVLEIAADKNLSKALANGHKVIEAEVVHACQSEYCVKPSDFLARRSRLAFTDIRAAEAALPRVVQLMGDTLNWGIWRRWKETWEARRYLQTFKCSHKIPLEPPAAAHTVSTAAPPVDTDVTAPTAPLAYPTPPSN